jgi:Bacteriocin-protection, YdeI or OmpD-Associated/Domain of unknown function (DUF1905)
MPPVLRFRATIQLTGLNPYLHVSAVRARSLKPGWRRAMPVLVRINGAPRSEPWRTNMMPLGDGTFRLYLQATVRRASATQVGDTVRAEVRFDTAYRGGPQHPMPSWFRRPLRANRKAWAAWQALIPSRKKEILRYLAQLKSPAARKRNVARALRALAGQPVRYMARSWGNHGER